MKSFKKHITEGKGSKKGWVHSKTGKTFLWSGMEPYHVSYVVKNLSKFRLKEKDVLDILEARFDRMDAPDPASEAKKELGSLKDGRTDIDRAVELLAVKKGWCRIVLGEWSEIAGYDFRQMHQAVKQLDKKGIIPYKELNQLEFYEIDEGNGPIKKGYKARYKRVDTIDNSYDVQMWVDGKSADPSNVGKGRTEIGRTMAMFREDAPIYPKSFLRNRKLMDLVKKHSDPFKFLFAVIDQMNRGKLNLKRIGASSTREVAALWNDYNSKQIPMSMVEDFIKKYDL